MCTVIGAREYMGPVEEALEKKFLPKILGLDSISGSLMKPLALRSKIEELGILNPTEAADKSHQTSLACIKRLVESLLTVEALSTIDHRACVRRIIRDGQDFKEEREEYQLDREKRNDNNKGRLRLEHANVAGAWITVVTHLRNGTTLS